MNEDQNIEKKSIRVVTCNTPELFMTTGDQRISMPSHQHSFLRREDYMHP